MRNEPHPNCNSNERNEPMTTITTDPEAGRERAIARATEIRDGAREVWALIRGRDAEPEDRGDGDTGEAA